MNTTLATAGDAGVVRLDGPGLRSLVEALRTMPADRAAELTNAATISGGSFTSMVDEATVTQLVDEGVMRPSELASGERSYAPQVTFWNAGGLVTVLPAPGTRDANAIYLSGDTLWLLDFLWKRNVRGARAAELGSGHGFLAAALASRFVEVVAADIDETCVRYMAATLAVNGLQPPRARAMLADVAAGLPAGSFDLVVANAPWSPAPPRRDDGVGVVWADGGHRGTALPLEFIRQSADLLLPGGEAVVLCLDTTWADGEQPLQAGLRDVVAAGFIVEVHPTEVIPANAYERLLTKTPQLVRAQHVAVVVTRPVRGETPDSAAIGDPSPGCRHQRAREDASGRDLEG
ncbi:MAG: methyltransferase [Acidimicrobiales bacterium]